MKSQVSFGRRRLDGSDVTKFWKPSGKYLLLMPWTQCPETMPRLSEKSRSRNGGISGLDCAEGRKSDTYGSRCFNFKVTLTKAVAIVLFGAMLSIVMWMSGRLATWSNWCLRTYDMSSSISRMLNFSKSKNMNALRCPISGPQLSVFNQEQCHVVSLPYKPFKSYLIRLMIWTFFNF